MKVVHVIGDETIHTPIQIKPSRISIVFANFFSLSDICSSTKALDANKRQSQRMDFNQWGSCACVKNILLWGFSFKILFHSQPRCYCGRAIVCATLKVIFSIHLGSPLLRIRFFFYLFCGFLLLRYSKKSRVLFMCQLNRFQRDTILSAIENVKSIKSSLGKWRKRKRKFNFVQ